MFEGAKPLQNPRPPPHARNTYPYHGEGDKGGEVEMMDKKQAIEFLKEEIKKIPHLAELAPNNLEYPVWHNTIAGILEEVFGRNSSEYANFSSKHKQGNLTARGFYIFRLRKRYIDLKSIIQKHEILGTETKRNVIEVLPEEIFREVPPKVFISHGKESAALRKLKEFLETLGIEPIIVKIQASLDKTVGDKVEYYLNQADFVIALATADDEVNGKMQPRQNVSHEIGLAQKTHKGRIIYLLEEGAEFGSNISPKVYERFKQRNMMNAFLGIVRELRAYGMLKIIKTPPEEHTL